MLRSHVKKSTTQIQIFEHTVCSLLIINNDLLLLLFLFLYIQNKHSYERSRQSLHSYKTIACPIRTFAFGDFRHKRANFFHYIYFLFSVHCYYYFLFKGWTFKSATTTTAKLNTNTFVFLFISVWTCSKWYWLLKSFLKLNFKEATTTNIKVEEKKNKNLSREEDARLLVVEVKSTHFYLKEKKCFCIKIKSKQCY